MDMSRSRVFAWALLWFFLIAPAAKARTIMFVPTQTFASEVSWPSQVSIRDFMNNGDSEMAVHKNVQAIAMSLAASSGALDAPTICPQFLYTWWQYRRGTIQRQRWQTLDRARTLYQIWRMP